MPVASFRRGAALLLLAALALPALSMTPARAADPAPGTDPTTALRAYLSAPAAAAQAPLRLAQSGSGAKPSHEGGLIIIPTDPPPEPDAPSATDEPGDPIIHFDRPMTVGAVPILGHSIAELVQGHPLYPPIEGLDPKFWRDKHCADCHQWTRERLCEQAKTYIGTEKMIFRLAHPYGAPFKVALARWAKAGCL